MNAKKTAIIGWSTVLGVTALLLFFGYMKNKWLLVSAFDTGLYLQLLDNLWNNYSWASSITGESNFLSHHFQPVVACLIPLYLISGSATMLYFVSAVAILCGIWLIDRECKNDLDPFMRFGFIISMVVHPTISGRLFHTFVPEVLAFPLLVIQGLFLMRSPSWVHKRRTGLIVCMLLTGITKETMWVINSFVAALLFIKHKPQRGFFAAVTLVNMALFAGLFFYFMPHHTNMSSYYGLRYFLGSQGGDNPSVVTIMTAMLGNIVSVRSCATLFYNVALMTLFLPFVWPSSTLWGALPGIVMILASSSPIVHHSGNHYLLAALPFMFLSSAHTLTHAPLFKQRQVTKYLWWFLPLYILSFTLFYGGMVNSFESMQQHPERAYGQEDLTQIKQELKEDAWLLVDGNIQPQLSHYHHVVVIQNFEGNPRLVGVDDFNRTTDVITMYDMSTMDNCNDFKQQGKEFPNYHADELVAYCNWIRTVPKITQKMPKSGLIHYKIIRP